MSIVRVYDQKNVRNRLIGYIKSTKNDFTEIPVVGSPKKIRISPNQNFYKKVKNELGRNWSDDFGWTFLSEVEIQEQISSYKRRSDFYSRQANRLETLNSL